MDGRRYRFSAQPTVTRLADVKARYQDGVTSLMVAVMMNQNPDVIMALLEAGADLKARDKDGEAPLMLAAEYYPNPEVIIAF